MRVIMQNDTSDKCFVYFDVLPPIYLANYITQTLYTGTDGENGIYYHDGIGTYTNADQEAGDNSYRYAGANPNNYVCFGSDEAICPNDNLYRIIGVFDGQVKLIKYDYANDNLLGDDGLYSNYVYTNDSSTYYRGNKLTINRYYWADSTTYNIWSESILNKVNLNTNYLASFEGKWGDLITESSWQVGGIPYRDSYGVSKAIYNLEVGINSTSGYNTKIGLMYISDYGYAASPENWQTTLYNYNNDTNRNNNWMWMGLDEFTISSSSNTAYDTFIISSNGKLDGNESLDNSLWNFIVAVRPCFYLKSNAEYVGGTGTESDPFRID